MKLFAEQTANHENSANPKLAMLSNDEAGYPNLGGRFRFNSVDGSETDYALFAYQVPKDRSLFISDICITVVVLGAAIGTEPTLLDWALGLNSSGQSLSCKDGPRRLPLGLMSFLGQAPSGTWGQDISFRFEKPLVVECGRWFHVIVQIPWGKSVPKQQFRGDVFVNHYFG